MIAKSTLRLILASQQKMLTDRAAGVSRGITADLPYLTDKPLLIGGIRGCGRSTLLKQLVSTEYTKAWYADFSDPRLAGFGTEDFRKLDELIAESGRGELLFDEIDRAMSWQDFLRHHAAQGRKVIATISNRSLRDFDEAGSMREHFLLRRLFPFSYDEFLESNHRRGGESSVSEYLARGGFPEQAKGRRPETLLRLYEEIILRDVILPNGIRDVDALQRVALHLIARCGEPLSANRLRDILKIKAVSTVTEHFEALDWAGLICLVPVWTDSPAIRNVNPRKPYVADGALALTVAPELEEKPDRLFENLIFNHLRRSYGQIYYTTEAGGCDFVAVEDGRPVRLVQACRSSEYEEMQVKTEGLLAAMERTGLRRGTIVTPDLSEKHAFAAGEIFVTDADTFLT